MSKTLNGAVLHNYVNDDSPLSSIVSLALNPSLTTHEIKKAISACETVNAQIADTMDALSGAAIYCETERLDIANALNLIADITRLNNDMLVRFANKLSEVRNE